MFTLYGSGAQQAARGPDLAPGSFESGPRSPPETGKIIVFQQNTTSFLNLKLRALSYTKPLTGQYSFQLIFTAHLRDSYV